MNLVKSKIIDLPKTQYRVLNPPAPPGWAVALTMAAIVVTALVWAII